MFLSAILLALIVGTLAGGGIPRLADLKLRWLWVLAIALAIRVASNLARDNGLLTDVPLGPAFILAYALIFVWLWGNWRVPGLQIASVGIASNTLAVVLNGGQMPVWANAFVAAGFEPEAIAGEPFHFLLVTDTVASFIGTGGIFGDVIPIPLPIIRDVISIGDVLLAIGIFWAIVYSMARPEAPLRRALTFQTFPARPAAVGGYGGGATYGPVTITEPAQPVAPGRDEPEQRGQSPYLRLVRNRNFSLLWTGQLISLFGDRIHVVALAYLVTTAGTPLEVGLTFAATAVPNVVFGPLAGALVDRWDRRMLMIVSDLLRAALVLLIPVAFEIHIGLVYAIAFAIATVTLVFRPAKTAVIPAVVEERDLLTANSASSVAEAVADTAGLVIAGVIVATLSGLIGAAFVLDAATYVVSAVLLWAMTMEREKIEAPRISIAAVWGEIVDGWRFLRRQAELLTNTVVTTVAQVAVGAEIVVSTLYAQDVLDRSEINFPENLSLLLAAIGLGGIVGGVVIGLVAERAPKGPMVITGLVGMGLSLAAVGLTTDPYVAIALFFVVGASNILFLVPTITLFQERTPQRMMGRVVASRQTLTFGMIALSMGVSGWLAGIIGPALVLAISGGICALAGLSGLLLPAMRGAR